MRRNARSRAAMAAAAVLLAPGLVALGLVASAPAALAQDAPGGAAAASTRISGANPGGGGTLTPHPMTGAEVYQQVCQACHMADARGATGAGTILPLANNPKLGVAAYPITVIIRGKGAMPWLDDVLTPDQIAKAIGYVRTHFGNTYPEPVTAAEVTQLETALGHHRNSFP